MSQDDDSDRLLLYSGLVVGGAIALNRLLGSRDPPPADPCADVTCPDGQVCEDGECVQSDPVDPCANVSCGTGEVCEDGDCIVVDPCAGVTCGPGEECQDGDCVVVDPCATVNCGPCEECVDGDCVPITCPDGEECVDGECVSIEPEPTVGGGADYATLHTGGDYVVSTTSELESALSRASSGEVVYVNGAIDVTGLEGIYVPPGVTLAGDRGAGDTSVLVCDDRGVNPLLDVHGRLEGVEVAGPIPDFLDYDMSSGSREVDYPVGIGITPGDGAEIANCYLHHFGVIVQNNRSANVHIHQSEIAWSAVEGLGYGIDCDSGGGDAGRAVIEYNFMHTCRHEIAAHGGDGYILRYNVFGEPQYSPWDGSLATQRVDDHDCCGFHEVYNNEFRPGNPNAFNFRDGVDGRSECHHNWFHDSNVGGLDHWPSGGVYDNHFGTSSPPGGIGIPR